VIKAKLAVFNRLKISKHFNITRSGLYRESAHSKTRLELESSDLSMVQTLFYEKKEKVGIRQIKMLIHRRFNKVMNRKKIARIKIQYGLITKIRKKKYYRRFIKLNQEHKTAPNHLSRQFKRKKVDEVYSTDVTQLNYGSGQKAYLAVFKDLGSKEIVSSAVSSTHDLKLVNAALVIALKKLPIQKRKGLMIHSDQGFEYTHINYRNQLKQYGITQSMSRKGNCIDNAPVESFFGYIKDHLDLKACKNIAELKTHVTKEIDYYNYERPQWDLKKMPPIKYRRHLTLTRGFY
jgi:transposase InsO family protein